MQHVAQSVTGAARERPRAPGEGPHAIGRRHAGEHAYLFQNTDGRVIFAIPYEQAFTLIGTTDTPFSGDPATAQIDTAEIAYLCDQASRHFREGRHAGGRRAQLLGCAAVVR